MVREFSSALISDLADLGLYHCYCFNQLHFLVNACEILSGILDLLSNPPVANAQILQIAVNAAKPMVCSAMAVEE